MGAQNRAAQVLLLSQSFLHQFVMPQILWRPPLKFFYLPSSKNFYRNKNPSPTAGHGPQRHAGLKHHLLLNSVNLNPFKAPIRRLAISGLLAMGMLALPSPLNDTPRASAATFPNTTGNYIIGKISWICACSVSATKPPELSSFDVRVDGVSNPVTSFTVFGSAIMDVTLASPVLEVR